MEPMKRTPESDMDKAKGQQPWAIAVTDRVTKSPVASATGLFVTLIS
jgi:hypothetical protein